MKIGQQVKVIAEGPFKDLLGTIDWIDEESGDVQVSLDFPTDSGTKIVKQFFSTDDVESFAENSKEESLADKKSMKEEYNQELYAPEDEDDLPQDNETRYVYQFPTEFNNTDVMEDIYGYQLTPIEKSRMDNVSPQGDICIQGKLGDLKDFAAAYGYMLNAKYLYPMHNFDYMYINGESRHKEKTEESVVKQGNPWVNKGEEGTHGKFDTKKEADEQRKAMFAKSYMENKLNESNNCKLIKYKDGKKVEEIDFDKEQEAAKWNIASQEVNIGKIDYFLFKQQKDNLQGKVYKKDGKVVSDRSKWTHWNEWTDESLDDKLPDMRFDGEPNLDINTINNKIKDKGFRIANMSNSNKGEYDIFVTNKLMGPGDIKDALKKVGAEGTVIAYSDR